MPGLLKSNHLRGDFVFRDVYKRHGFSTFSGNEVSEHSTLYIDENEDAVNCTSQISTYTNGVGSFRLYTRNGQEFDKANAESATVSVNSSSAIFRSSNTHVSGGFTVKSLLKVDPAAVRVGVNEMNPAYTLDVNGDCNIRGNLLVNGNTLTSSLPANTLFSTSSTTYGTTTPFLYQGPGDAYGNGVPFFELQEATGDVLVVASGTNNSVFTFAKTGIFVVQAEVEGTYPFLPEGGASTYFLKNGQQQLGVEKIAYGGADAFGCSRTYVMNAQYGDTVRFIIDSVTQNMFETGIYRCRLSFVENRMVNSEVTANNAIVNTLTATVLGNLQAGNVSTSSVVATAITTSTLTTSNLRAEKLTVNGAEWASTVAHGTSTPFLYYGPGNVYSNGVPFYNQTASNGTSFVSPSGTGNSVFTFAIGGTYFLQAEVQIGHPSMPESIGISSFFVKNLNPALRLGEETHSSDRFSCTRPYLLTVDPLDNVRFVIDSSTGNDYEVGINASRLSILKLA